MQCTRCKIGEMRVYQNEMFCTRYPACRHTQASPQGSATDGITYVAFDFETSGRSHKEGRVIEIGAAKVRNGVIIEEFSELIDPGFLISMIITEITGIRNQDLRGRRKEQEVFADFIRFIEGASFLMAHNLPFDAKFLKDACKRLDIPVYDGKGICTLSLSRKRVNASSHKLGDLCLHFGIHLSNAHRAIFDVRAMVELYEKHLKQPEDLIQAKSFGEFAKN